MLAGRDDDPQRIAVAQVHATLALAAAIGLSADLPRADADAWREVAATPVDQAVPVQPPQRDNHDPGPWRGSWESRRGCLPPLAADTSPPPRPPRPHPP